MAARIELLGGFTLRSSTGEDVTPTAKKACALLAYLALQRDRTTSRGTAAALLWEESGESQARSSLRQALVAVRRALPEQELICSDGETLALTSGVTSDVEEVEQVRESGPPREIEQAAALIHGDFLDGFDPHAPAFEEWAALERERLRRCAEALLTRLLHHHQERGDAAAAAAAAARVLHIDPLREDVHRTLMSLYARLGRRAAALNQYRICRRSLARHLGVDPEPETEALRRAIESERRQSDGDTVPARPENGEPEHPVEAPAPARPAAAPDRRLREVTMLHALAAATEGGTTPEDLARAESALDDTMVTVMASLGGTMIRSGPDGSVAAFGVPSSHGNEPHRAVRAALLLAQRLDDSCCRARVGLATGLMLANADMNVSLSGEPARRAAQLAARAQPGDILADSGVWESLRDRLAAERAGDAWLVRGLHSVTEQHQPLVGREAECRHLRRLLADCADGDRGQTIVIRGEAGIGKTRLLHAVLRQATESGFTTHLTTVLDFGDPDDVERSLAAQLVGLSSDPEPAQVTAAVDGVLSSGLMNSEHRGHLLNLLGLADDASESEVEAEPLRRRASLLPELVRSAARGGPVLVVVEDTHWAPPRVRLLLARLAAATADASAVLLMTTRAHGDPVDAAWRSAAAPSSLTVIDLGPLRPAELVAIAGEQGQVEAPILEQCIRRSDGNPLFFRQLLRAAAAGVDELPGTIRSLVSSRMDCLPAPDQLALEAAAALGQRFRLEEVRLLAGIPGWAPDAAAEEGLVRPDEDGWAFAHSLIRDAVYTSMTGERTSRLHQLAARFFESTEPALEAEHLEAARDPAAATAWLRAARRGLERHRLEIALERAERGLAAGPEPLVLHELELVRGESLELLGEAEAAAAAFRHSLSEAVSDRGRGSARLGLASALRRAERHEEALAVLDEAGRDLAGAGDDEALARLESIRSGIHFILGRLDACLESTRLALEASRRSGSPASEARALGALGDAEYQCGRVARAHAHYDACVRLADAHGMAGVAVAHLGMRGLTNLYRLRVGEAQADASEAATRAAGLGHLRAEMVARNVAATVELEVGLADDALASAERSLELALRLSSRLFEAENLNMKAHALGVLGRRAEGCSLAARAWEISSECGATFSGPWILANLARLSDDPARRRWALTTGETILKDGGSCHSHLHFRQLAILGALEDRCWSEARRHAEMLDRYRGDEPFEMAEILADCGRVLAAWGEGDHGPGSRQRIGDLAERVSGSGAQSVSRCIAAAGVPAEWMA